MRNTIIIILLLGLAGCVSKPISQSHSFGFPALSDDSYPAPDGRVWVVHESRRISATHYVIIFTPESLIERGKWTEMLRFEYSSRVPSVEQLTSIFDEVKEKDDPRFTYEIIPTPSGYIARHQSPRWNESGISKNVLREHGGVHVSYTSRLVSDPQKRSEFWSRYISDLPNQALQPTRMLVTFCAYAQPAPSTRVAVMRTL